MSTCTPCTAASAHSFPRAPQIQKLPKEYVFHGKILVDCCTNRNSFKESWISLTAARMNYSWLFEKWSPRSLTCHISRVLWNHTKLGAQQGKGETTMFTRLTRSIPKRAVLCLQWTLQPKGTKIIQQLLKINPPSGPCFLSCNSHQSRGVKPSLSHVSARVLVCPKALSSGCLARVAALKHVQPATGPWEELESRMSLSLHSMQGTLCSWKLKKIWDFSSLQVKCEQILEAFNSAQVT